MIAYDVVAAGGGVIGLAVAWRLAQRGQRVAVLDTSMPGGASQAAAGMLAPLAEAHGDSPFVEMGLDSLAMYPAFLEELNFASGVTIALAGAGMLRVAQTVREADMLQAALSWQSSRGLPVSWLGSEDTRAHEPALARTVVGAVFSPRERHVTPRRLHQALRQACLNAGVHIFSNAKLQGVNTVRQRVTRARTSDGEVDCAQLILTTGAWTSLPPESLPITLPIRPVRGQALTLAAPHPLPLTHTIYGTEGYLVPRESESHIMVGATEEEAGYEAVTTAQEIQGLTRMAARLVPMTEQLPILEQWAGLRPITPDGLPLMGQLPGWDNVFLASGHGRNGILLAPITASLMAEMLIDSVPLPSAFSPARFAQALAFP